MNRSARLLLALIAVVAILAAQSSPPPGPPPQTPAQTPEAETPQEQPGREEPAYVRRFSAGITMTVLGLKPIPEKEVTQVFSSPALEVRSKTIPTSHLVGGGFTVQLAILRKLALCANVFYRKVEYEDATVLLAGVDNPKTETDERQATNLTDTTRAQYWDIPILVRYYNLERHEEGNRWFFELGPALRYVRGIRSTLGTQPPGGEVTTVETSVTPSKRELRGATAGFGVQLIDPVGVRVVPEVRYTRWFGNVFANRATQTRRDQLEALISLTF